MLTNVLLGHVAFDRPLRRFWCIECAEVPQNADPILSQDLELLHGLKTGTLHPSEFEFTPKEVEAMLYPLECSRCSRRFYVTDDEVTGYWHGPGRASGTDDVVGDDE